MKKDFFKILCVNILFVILIFVILDFIFFQLAYKNFIDEHKELGIKYKIQNPYKLKKFEEDYNGSAKSYMKEPEGINYNKRPIIVFGCSYAYGFFLNKTQDFSYKLSNLTKRPVYNRANISWGVQHMLYQLQKESDMDKIKNPEYIVFVFVEYNIASLFFDTAKAIDRYLYLKYIEKNYKLYQKSSIFVFFQRFYLIKKFQKIKDDILYKNPKYRDKNFDLLKLHFIESKKLVEHKYPNSKFVILKYRHIENSWYFDTIRWNELKQEGFTVIDTKELSKAPLWNEKYKLPNDSHPNESAWDVVVPEFIKKICLN